jgi:hypothetical protein
MTIYNMASHTMEKPLEERLTSGRGDATGGGLQAVRWRRAAAMKRPMVRAWRPAPQRMGICDLQLHNHERNDHVC